MAVRLAAAGLACLALLGGAVACAGCAANGDNPCSHPHEILVKRVVPPSDNPYPPRNDLDVRRVALVKEAIALFWTSRLDEDPLRERMKAPHDPRDDDVTKGPDAFVFRDKTAACLRDVECWSKDYPFLRRVRGQAASGDSFLVSRVLWVHVVPWSLARYGERTLPLAERHYADVLAILEAQQRDYRGTSEPHAFSYRLPTLRDDEYLVDAVVQMKKQNGFFHLLHVVGEDAAGQPGLRWSDVVPIDNDTRESCYH